jgi:hypothetical protein
MRIQPIAPRSLWCGYGALTNNRPNRPLQQTRRKEYAAPFSRSKKTGNARKNELHPLVFFLFSSGSSGLPNRNDVAERSGPPSLPDNPRGPWPVFLTPAGPVIPCLGGTPLWSPRCPPRRLPPVLRSKLRRTASALAVYASSSSLRCRRRQTRFRWLVRPCRVALVTHRVATKGFNGARFLLS